MLSAYVKVTETLFTINSEMKDYENDMIGSK